MIARSHFRHDAAIRLMRGGLRCDSLASNSRPRNTATAVSSQEVSMATSCSFAKRLYYVVTPSAAQHVGRDLWRFENHLAVPTLERHRLCRLRLRNRPHRDYRRRAAAAWSGATIRGVARATARRVACAWPRRLPAAWIPYTGCSTPSTVSQTRFIANVLTPSTWRVSASGGESTAPTTTCSNGLTECATCLFRMSI